MAGPTQASLDYAAKDRCSAQDVCKKEPLCRSTACALLLAAALLALLVTPRRRSRSRRNRRRTRPHHPGSTHGRAARSRRRRAHGPRSRARDRRVERGERGHRDDRRRAGGRTRPVSARCPSPHSTFRRRTRPTITMPNCRRPWQIPQALSRHPTRDRCRCERGGPRHPCGQDQRPSRTRRAG